MKDFEALKNIWHGQAALPVLSYDEVLRKIKSSRSAFSNKLLLQVISLCIAILAMAAVLFRIPFRFGTSQLAIIIFLCCCVTYLVMQVRDYKKIRDSDHLMNAPEAYIAWLKSYKQARYILNTRVYRIYMLFMGIGIALYFIEIFYFVSLWQTITAIGFTVAWFFICYFVFMRRYIRKEEARLNEMIRNLERLAKQFGKEAEAV